MFVFWGPTYPPPQVLLLAPHASPSLTFSDKWRAAACLVWPGPQPCLTQTRQFRKWRWLMATTRSRRQNQGGDLLCRGGSAETNLTPTFCRSSKCLQSGTNRAPFVATVEPLFLIWILSEMQIDFPLALAPGLISASQRSHYPRSKNPFYVLSDKSQWNSNVNYDIFYVVKIIFCRQNIWYFPCVL